MAIPDHVPLMKKGSTKRNLVVVALYLVFLPIVLIVFPFYLLFAIGTNRNGLGHAIANSPLSSIPGVGGGGWSAAIIIFIGVMVIFGAMGAALPGPDSAPNGTEPEGSDNADNVEESNDDSDDENSNDGSNPEGTDDSSTDDTSDDSGDDGSDTETGADSDADTSDESPSGPQLTELQSIRTVDDRYDPYSTMLEGSGQQVTEEFSAGGQAGVFIFEHDGESNFIVELINAETGDREEILINEIGTTDGAVAVPTMPGDYYLDVTADGSWSIEVAEPFPEEDDIHQPPVEGAGEGKDVIGPVEIDDRVTVTGEHSGESNFIVTALDELAMYPSDQELVFNEIGQFQGETTITYDGIVWIVVEADGNWSIEIE